MVGALIALVGGLIGATIGSVTNYLIAWQKQKNDTKAEERKNQIEIKRAARLIQMELLAGFSALNAAIKMRAWVLTEISTCDWKKYSHVLAPIMPDKDWLDLCVAEMSLDYVESARVKAVKATLPTYELPESFVAVLNKDAERINRGLEVLKPWHLDQSLATKNPRLS